MLSGKFRFSKRFKSICGEIPLAQQTALYKHKKKTPSLQHFIYPHRRVFARTNNVYLNCKMSEFLSWRKIFWIFLETDRFSPRVQLGSSGKKSGNEDKRSTLGTSKESLGTLNLSCCSSRDNWFRFRNSEACGLQFSKGGISSPVRVKI